ncbi:MAG: TetR/AcrR family transcriptional regulator [Devosiaceae bacterium]|nr:TetR/AcrR family transcriptional regulator [Devosiaceae bacterium MH13]
MGAEKMALDASEALPYRERKSRDILVAARKLFFDRGLEAVSIEEIADAAGVAKTTIYYKFGRKQDIFDAVFEQLGEGAIDSIPGDIDPDMPVRDALIQICTGLMMAMANRELMGPEPVFLLEAKRKPELGRKFYELGPGRMHSAFQDLISGWADRGLLAVSDSYEAAEDLAVLCQGLLPIRLQSDPELTLSEAQVNERVERGVDKFLKLYGPEASEAT